MSNVRARRTLANLVITHKRGVSFADAMRRAGYSESYARNPQKIKRTRAWRELQREYLPDEAVLQSHRSLLESYKPAGITFPAALEDGAIRELIKSVGGVFGSIRRGRKTCRVEYWVPDASARAQGIGLFYRMTGGYRDSGSERNALHDLSDAELQEEIQRLKMKTL